MAGEAAITKVKERLLSWLQGNVTGAEFELDRPYDTAYGDEELATAQVNIRCSALDFSIRNYDNAMVHTGQFMFDITTRSMTLQTIDARQAEVAAGVVARLGARTEASGTIGELLEFCDPVAMGTGSDDQSLADHGEITLAYRMVWITPLNDFKTIVSVNGTLIP